MKILIWIVVSVLLLPSLLALLGPNIAVQFTGLDPSLAGLTEVRATFGGFHLGFIVFLVWCCFSAERYRYALLAIALMLGGAALGRFCGIIVDGMPTTTHYMGLGTEIPLALTAAWLLRSHDSNSLPTDHSSDS